MAKKTAATLKSRCPWCDRPGSTCWTMPCLELETALIEQDDDAMLTWAASAAPGATLTRRDGSEVRA